MDRLRTVMYPSISDRKSQINMVRSSKTSQSWAYLFVTFEVVIYFLITHFRHVVANYSFCIALSINNAVPLSLAYIHVRIAVLYFFTLFLVLLYVIIDTIPRAT